MQQELAPLYKHQILKTFQKLDSIAKSSVNINSIAFTPNHKYIIIDKSF